MSCYEWIDITKSLPTKESEMGGWKQSDLIWLKIQNLDENKNPIGKPYAKLGRCIWPTKVGEFIPKSQGENPAVTVTWVEDEPFFQADYHKVNVTHWTSLTIPEV